MNAIIHLDQQLFTWINTVFTCSVFDLILPVIRNKITWVPLYILIAISLYIRDKSNTYKWILLCLIGIIFTDNSISLLLKNWIQRIRPCNIESTYLQVRLLVHCSTTYSFPSAHAGNHAFLATIFTNMACYYDVKYIRSIILALCIWVISIAYAQVYVGVHFPIDVVGGILLGVFIGVVFTFIFNKWMLKNASRKNEMYF